MIDSVSVLAILESVIHCLVTCWYPRVTPPKNLYNGRKSYLRQRIKCSPLELVEVCLSKIRASKLVEQPNMRALLMGCARTRSGESAGLGKLGTQYCPYPIHFVQLLGGLVVWLSRLGSFNCLGLGVQIGFTSVNPNPLATVRRVLIWAYLWPK